MRGLYPPTTDDVRDLTREEYELFRKLVYELAGINLGEQKMQLVRARLGKRLRAGGFRSYREYYEFVRQDSTGNELVQLLDAIATNTTHLFREKQHFDFLAERLRAWIDDRAWRSRNGSEARIWSAACSSGEEPHSLAMTADDALRGTGVTFRILATDLSTRMLERAGLAVYEPHRLGTVPEAYRNRYFARVSVDGRPALQVVPELRRAITFSRLNLMAERFPFRHGFHFIFCRNVMIYFDRPTQQTLVNKLAGHVRPGGYLIIGHSESLNGIPHPFNYVRPTIYQKPQ